MNHVSKRDGELQGQGKDMKVANVKKARNTRPSKEEEAEAKEE